MQSAFRAGSEAAAKWYIGDLETFVGIAFDKMAAAGATITDASDELREQWASGMDNAAKTWAEGLDAAGKDGSGILTEYMDRMRAGGAKPLRDWDKE